VLAAGIGGDGKIVLEQEHQRRGHIRMERLLALAKQGKLKGTYEDLRKHAVRTDQRDVYLPAKIERYPKDGEALCLRGCSDGVRLDIDLAEPLYPSLGVHRYMFVGVDRWSGIIFAAPIWSTAWAMQVVTAWRRKGSSHKVRRWDGVRQWRSARMVSCYGDSALHLGPIHPEVEWRQRRRVDGTCPQGDGHYSPG
jgi:hypothetical protein